MFRTRWALVVVLAACLLGGCSDDDPEPDIGSDTTPSPTVSESVSTSPTVTPSVAPTARDSVDLWLEAWTAAMQTGETQAVTDMSTAECESCERLIAKVEEVYGKGGRYETEGWSATRVSEAPDSASATPSYVMQVVQTKRSLFGADGQLVDEAAETKVPMRMTFRSRGGAWVLDRLEILE